MRTLLWEARKMVNPCYVMKKYFIALLPKIIWKAKNVPNELTKLREWIKLKCNLVSTAILDKCQKKEMNAEKNLLVCKHNLKRVSIAQKL